MLQRYFLFFWSVVGVVYSVYYLPISLIRPDWTDEEYLEEGSRKNSIPCSCRCGPAGGTNKTSVNQAVLQRLKWSAMLMLLFPAAASVSTALPVVAHLTAWGLHSDLFIADLSGVKTCPQLEESRSRDQHTMCTIPNWALSQSLFYGEQTVCTKN